MGGVLGVGGEMGGGRGRGVRRGGGAHETLCMALEAVEGEGGIERAGWKRRGGWGGG